MNFTKWIILVLFSFALVSCKKLKKNNEQDFQIVGTVNDLKTNIPIQNAKVMVLENSMGMNNYKEISSTYTTLGGKYTINTGDLKPSLNGSQFRIRFMHPDYLYFIDYFFSKEYTDNANVIVLDKKIILKNVFLIPNSYVKLKVKNINPFNENDDLFLEVSNSLFTNSIHLKGGNVDTILQYVSPPPSDFSPNVYIRYKIFRNNIWSDNLFMQQPLIFGDTINVNLAY